MAYVDSMVLGAGHSLMISHTPNQVPLQALSDKYFEASKVMETHSSFGLFSPDVSYNNYYPEVTSREFKPEEDEFIEPMFRLLSSCIVAKNRMPTDFSKPGVLKNSMQLLVGQSVYCDHEDSVGNAIGAVSEVTWQNEYKDETGVKIPAGINGILKIDGKSNPRIARGINMDPPSIHSNSVTVQFEWEPSHQFENIYDFFDKLGTYDEKGNMVRRIVTKILTYKETSLVSHGADPFAQIIKDGRLNNPIYANRQYNSFSEDMVNKFGLNEVENKLDMLDYKNVDTMYNTSKPINKGEQPQVSITKNSNQNMEEIQKFLESLFGADMLTLAEGSQVTSELALSQIRDLAKYRIDAEAKLADFEATKEKLTAAEGEVIALKETITGLEKNAELGKTFITKLRETTEASYKKMVGEENVDANIIALINSNDTGEATLTSLNKTYETQLNEKFPLHCASCGSKDVNRASSQNAEGGEGKGAKTQTMSNTDIIKDLAREKRFNTEKQ